MGGGFSESGVGGGASSSPSSSKAKDDDDAAADLAPPTCHEVPFEVWCELRWCSGVVARALSLNWRAAARVQSAVL